MILGLDLSTSCTGMCLLDGDNIILDYIKPPAKLKGLFNKSDFVVNEIIKKLDDKSIEKLYIEEPLMAASRKSTAHVLFLLARFNAIVSYELRKHLKIEPALVNVAAARKVCGIQVKRKSICGIDAKKQAFNYMIENDLKNYNFPKTKTGSYKPFCYDENDAYIVAKGGMLLNL